MKSYRELEVYKESKVLVIRIHKLSLALPKFELYEEGSQIRRSSKAVASAIVEGYGRRNYKPEFIRYLIFAITECDETILHLEFLFETESLKDLLRLIPAINFAHGNNKISLQKIFHFFQKIH